MSYTLLHLTDLHFGQQSGQHFPTPDRLANELLHCLQGVSPTPKCIFAILSGDLVYQANADQYKVARMFVDQLASKLSISREQIVICPGNHDICAAPDQFTHIDKMIFSVCGLEARTFTNRPGWSQIVAGLELVVINTSYHFDRSFGLVDEGHLPRLGEKRHPRVLVCHHNPISIYRSDASSIRNAIHLLHYCTEYKIDLLLHGHQHSELSLRLGDRGSIIVGTGSANFRDHNGNPPSFNLITLSADSIQISKQFYQSSLVPHSGESKWIQKTQFFSR